MFLRMMDYRGRAAGKTHGGGENQDERFFPDLEKVFATYKQQSRERANRLLQGAGLRELPVPDDE